MTPEAIAAVEAPVYLYWDLSMRIVDGRFEVKGLEPVEHVLMFRMPGFPREFARWKPGDRLDLVTMRPGGTIQGRVTDAAGLPVEGVWMRAVLSDIDLRQSGGDTTNVAGEFKIDRLRPATYRVVGVRMHPEDGRHILCERDDVVVERGAVTHVGDVRIESSD